MDLMFLLDIQNITFSDYFMVAADFSKVLSGGR